MPTSLNDLPAEIRILIYEHLFTGRNIVYSPPQQHTTRYDNQGQPLRLQTRAWFRPEPEAKGPAAILLASRLNYSEARPILLSTANINWSHMIKSDWTTKLQPECMPLSLAVRHLRLSWRTITRYPGAVGLLKKSLRHLPNIQSVVVACDTWFGGVHVRQGSYTLANGMLKPLIQASIVNKARIILALKFHNDPVWEALCKLWRDRDGRLTLKIEWSSVPLVLAEDLDAPALEVLKAEADYSTQVLLIKDTANTGRFWTLRLPMPGYGN